MVTPGGAWRPPGTQPGFPDRGSGRGRVSPVRLVAVFVVVLVIALGVGAAVVLALQPAPKRADCPDPAVQCGRPPIAPTLPPAADAPGDPAATPVPAIVRPSGLPASPSGAPSGAATAGPTSGTSPATPASAPPIADLPQPVPAGDSAPLRTGATWTSRDLGFGLEYNDRVWEIQEETGSRLVLAAGNGAVLLSVEGFQASGASPKALIQQKIRTLGDAVLGLTEEADPSRQLPGRPIVGHRQGLGALMNGTLDSPQGPSTNVDVVILAATDSSISLRVTLLADDDLRDPAFAAADSILNSIEWPAVNP
jgi:hypothetical protein